MQNVMKIETTPIQMPEKQLQSFNLLAQILPNQRNFEDNKHYSVEELVAGSVEFKTIEHLFLSSFERGNPTHIGIQKLSNMYVQEKFMTEFRLLVKKYRDKSLTQLVKLLFHGAKSVHPEQIYAS